MLKSKTMPKIGVDMLYFAPLKSDPVVGEPEYDEPVRVPGLVQVAWNPNAQTGTYYADNGAYATAAQKGDLSMTVGMADIPPELAAIWFGHDYEDGVVFEGQINPIEMAVGYRVKKSDGAYRYFWCFKGKAAPPQTSTDTQSNSISFQGGSITINFATLVSTGKDSKWVDDDGPDLPVGLTPKMIEDNWFTDPMWVLAPVL